MSNSAIAAGLSSKRAVWTADKFEGGVAYMKIVNGGHRARDLLIRPHRPVGPAAYHI
jgi:hypothetical protein